MDEDMLAEMAMADMMGGAPDGMAAPAGDPFAMTQISVPAFAVPAVMELVAGLEQEMSGGMTGPAAAPF